MKRDYENKDAAKKQEELAQTISSYENTPTVNKLHPENQKYISPVDWEVSVKNNIQDGEKQIHNSIQLRGIIENTLKKIYEDQVKQVEATNRAIRKRIDEIRIAKRKMEENLGLVLKQITEIEDNIEKIKETVGKLLKAAEIVETKQIIRDNRPDPERAKDTPYYK